MDPRMPDFVIPGFTRCGTTWLYEVLRLHPSICLPLRKEINFFNRAYERGQDWYAAYFADCPNDRVTGDISPVYAEDPAVPSRIHETLPDARLVLLVRDHVARIRSIYWHLVRDGRANDDLTAFLDGSSAGSAFMERQRYAPVLERYLGLFPRERVLILVYEELRADPRAAVASILEFLGVPTGAAWPPEMEAKLGQRVNPTFAPARPGFYRRAQRLHQTLRRTQLRVLDRPLDLGKKAFFALAGQRDRAELGPVPGEERVRRFLADDTVQVEQVLGRPLRDLWA